MPVETAESSLTAVGAYDLVERIAEGGMGTVYRGRHRDTGMTVAIKIVPASVLKNPVFLKRFQQEYSAARSLDHPNVVKALDFGIDGSAHYLVMEFVEGETLGSYLARVKKLSESEAIPIVRQIAEGLQAAHDQGLIHRDVKPDNILLTRAGVAKITDLGLVKESVTDQGLTRTGRGLGTPHFMAPEQFRNAKHVDKTCDIYSLGATMYMMVTGEIPFEAESPLETFMKKSKGELAAPRTISPEISERLDWAIRRALSPDPAVRPESCREFMEDVTGDPQLSSNAPAMGEEPSTVSDFWFLYYTTPSGEVRMLKGTTAAVRNKAKNGDFGNLNQVHIARSKAGPFEVLKRYPAFRDLVVEPGRAKAANKETKPETMSANTVEASLETTVPLPFPINPTPTTLPWTSGIVPIIALEKTEAPPKPAEEGTSLIWPLFLAVVAGLLGYFLLPHLHLW